MGARPARRAEVVRVVDGTEDGEDETLGQGRICGPGEEPCDEEHESASGCRSAGWHELPELIPTGRGIVFDVRRAAP